MSAPNGFSVAAARGAGGAQSSLKHAFLDVREPPPKGKLTPGAPLPPIKFQFNPKELTISKAAKWGRDAQKGGKKSAVPQFKGAEPSKLALEMFFDASLRHDDSVVKTVERLFDCCVPTDETHKAKQGTPPLVIFRWGSLASFTGFIKSVSAKYTLFTATGVPIRAIATVNIEELADEPAGQNPTSGALTARSVHTVVAGDTLASVAWREYGDPTIWRVIAEANEIDDPMRLRPGTELLLPAAEEIGV